MARCRNCGREFPRQHIFQRVCDGFVISIAPLWELAPWKEAQKSWEKLTAGEFEWSAMSQQMQERGLVKVHADSGDAHGIGN
jgi:hypothetical protein